MECKEKMFATDQTDHGARLADDLHVVQPWGRRCNGEVRGGGRATREDDRDIEGNNCNKVNDIHAIREEPGGEMSLVPFD